MAAKGQIPDLEVERPRLTASGLAVWWLAVGLLVIGVLRYDGALIWLGGVGMIVMVVARWWAPKNLRDLELVRRRPARVFAGETFELTLVVRRPETMPSWYPRTGCAVEIRDGLLPKRQPGVFLARGLRPGEWAEGSASMRCFRRGRYRRTSVEIRTRFPLGLFETRASGTLLDDRLATDGGLVVYPQPFLPEALKRDLELARFDLGSRHGIEPEPGEEYRGIREYRSGDPVKAVHWPATARAGGLMVREWDPPAPRPARYGLLLHTWEKGGGRLLRPDRWELALRMATGLVAHCRATGIGLWFADETGRSAAPMRRIPEAVSFGEALMHLALVPRVRMPGMERFRASLEQLVAQCDRVFVISDVPQEYWRGEIETWAHGNRVVCIDAESVVPVRKRVALTPEVVSG